MNRFIDLQTALLDLLQKVHDSDVRLIAGGGFGIYLKTDYVRKRTRIMKRMKVLWNGPVEALTVRDLMPNRSAGN